MASPSDTDRTEQIIIHFLHKTLHVVLASRIPHIRPAPRPSAGKRDRWFNLNLGDLPAPIAYHGAFTDPLVIDILLTPRRDAAESEAGEAVVERWIAQCVPWPAASHHPNDVGSFQSRTYKKSAILLRSLYSLLRILPSHRIFRMLCSSAQSYNYELGYRVSSFAAPFSRAEEADLKQYRFTPVETLFGQLVVSVQYRPSLAAFHLEISSPIAPMIITDYIGSPAAERTRPFPSSLPNCTSRPTTSQNPPRGFRPSAAAAPQFDRPHSWNVAPMAHHPLSSPLDRVAKVGSSPPEHYGRLGPNQRSLSDRKGNLHFDDFRLSPPFSTSTSSSPPTLGGHSLRSRLHMETAPMSIPVLATGKNQTHRSPNLSDPFKSLLPPPSPRSTRPDPSSQESPSKSRSFRKSEGLSGGDIYSNLHMPAAYKGLKDGRDDSGRFSALSSGGSPRYAFSRSSSRFSMQDDLDDTDFSYPFAVDDVDASDSHTRSPDVKDAEYSSSHKSQQAAVGILVHMLKTAPPLRQDQSCSSQSSDLNGEISMSSSVLSRKTSDALEELQAYQDMKNFLLSKSGAGTKLQESLQEKRSKE
ncbi:autophagy-related protein 13a-like [Curcuma longa]|uniref:autophagy-related protein 13a-like n=1 Tax=Curcuma longa TaxID=136217 RepID=UPI003D9E3BDF